MFPAGEMWSVVIESPKTARILALTTGYNGVSAWLALSKKGGLWIYVDSSLQLKWREFVT